MRDLADKDGNPRSAAEVFATEPEAVGLFTSHPFTYYHDNRVDIDDGDPVSGRIQVMALTGSGAELSI